MPFETLIDMREAENRAAETWEVLKAMRNKHELARYEFTQTVRIAPLEQPHSHPVLTIGPSYNRNEEMFVANYLHQQVKRYLLDHRGLEVDQALEKLAKLYPRRPAPGKFWSEDKADVHLDLIACRLELNLVQDLFGGSVARKRVETAGVRRWCYREAWFRKARLIEMLDDLGITPVPDARMPTALEPAA
ncbi:MAG: hypothetical protein AAF557_12530 [Pseudomonadota bacterium]